jgi:hypothetical protein
MFAHRTSSSLGLDLGPSSVPPSTVSAQSSFAVESYTPIEGFAGTLLTVNLNYFTTITDDQDQADFRLIINDKKLCSKVEHGPNGKVTLHALISTSLASLSGLVPMSLHLYRDGLLSDYCNFGCFNLVPVPICTYL